MYVELAGKFVQTRRENLLFYLKWHHFETPVNSEIFFYIFFTDLIFLLRMVME